MSGFTGSGVFVQWPLAMIAATRPTTYAGVTADVLKAALYNNTGTPNKSDTGANTGYNTGQWVTANEVIDSVGPGTNWAAGGRTLVTVTSTVSTNVYTMDAVDTAGAGNVTLSGVMGALVYDSTITGTNPVAKQGICFNYFGGAQAVTAGTFTIVWNSSGIMTITV